MFGRPLGPSEDGPALGRTCIKSRTSKSAFPRSGSPSRLSGPLKLPGTVLVLAAPPQVQLAARHAPDDQARLAVLKDAAALYRGPLADGAGHEWAEPYAETARRSALDTWTAIAELLEPADPDQALAALEAALGHDPYNEYLYLRIMRLQATAGRPDAARRTLALLETRLAELGVTPAAQTPQAAATLPSPPGPSRPPAAR